MEAHAKCSCHAGNQTVTPHEGKSYGGELDQFLFVCFLGGAQLHIHFLHVGDCTTAVSDSRSLMSPFNVPTRHARDGRNGKVSLCISLHDLSLQINSENLSRRYMDTSQTRVRYLNVPETVSPISSIKNTKPNGVWLTWRAACRHREVTRPAMQSKNPSLPVGNAARNGNPKLDLPRDSNCAFRINFDGRGNGKRMSAHDSHLA